MRGQTSQLLSLILLALLIGGVLLFVSPLQKKVAANRASVDVRSLELQSLQSEFDSLKTLADEVAKSEAKRDILLNAVPIGHSEDDLLVELTDLTASLAFGVNAINFALGSDPDLGDTVTVTANFEGSFANLVEFLQQIENADRLFQVKSISVQRTGTDEVVFNLIIEAYYQ